MRHRLVVILSIVASLGLAACDSVQSGQPASDESSILPTHRDMAGGPAALQRGSIVALGPCVALEEALQHFRWLIVWPSGYRLRGRAVVDGQGRQVVQIGDVVDLGGGEYEPSQYESLRPLLETEPAVACRGGSYWLATDIARR